MSDQSLRILIVAEHASMRLGGEASLPLYYFKLFRQRGIETWMLVHSRTRDELRESLGDDFERVCFVDDTPLHRFLWCVGQRLPRKIDEQTLGVARHLWTQILQRRKAKKLVREHGVTVIHETMPISPKEISIMHNLGAPLVIGPLGGGMDYPPAFQYMQSAAARIVERFGRGFAHVVHLVARGKIEADALIVANQLTRDALPRGAHGKVYEVVESGVDLAIWKVGEKPAPADAQVRFVFSGRLVDWKGVDLLIEAFGDVAKRTDNTVLEIIGDGPLRLALEARAGELN